MKGRWWSFLLVIGHVRQLIKLNSCNTATIVTSRYVLLRARYAFALPIKLLSECQRGALESSTHGTSCDRNYPQQTPPFIPSQAQPYSLLLIQTSIQPSPILPLFLFTCIFSPTGMLLVSLQSEVMLG